MQTAMSEDWKTKAAKRKAQQDKEIPDEWRIPKLPNDQWDVMDVPRNCGLLSEHEIRITETDNVELLLRNLAGGIWTSLEVTLAFYKRAIVAQQLVECCFRFPPLLTCAY
jgi:amidase